MKKLSTAVAVAVMTLGSLAAQAEDASCSTVKMADPGWSDIAATNAIASVVLDGLGYTPKVDTLAVPIAYGGLKDGKLDVFLGNWMPAQQGLLRQVRGHRRCDATGEKHGGHRIHHGRAGLRLGCRRA